ncbi:MAG: guanylate kinase [Fimbriimonadales bacterium]
MNRNIVIVSGPSGVGKDTIINAWKALNPRVERVVTFTTRKMREGEENGVDYHFVSERVFLRMAKAGDFLEHKEVHGNHYGTPVQGLAEIVDAKKIAVLKIDVQGALTVIPKLPGVLSVFLMPPSFEELERRLKNRDTETDAQIKTRIKNAKREIAAAVHYTAKVVNDNIDRCVQEIQGIYEAAAR